MRKHIRNAIINGAKVGLNIPELALYFCSNKDKVTHKDYMAFCSWAKSNEKFFYWLRSRLNVDYKG